MYICGIDVAKYQHAAQILDGEGQVQGKAFTVQNTAAGFDELLERLKRLAGAVTIGLEATGHYWLALYETLTAAGYPVVVLNPLQVAAYRRSGIRKVKTDHKDAWWVADYVRIANLPVSTQTLPTLLQMRELSRFRYRLVEQVSNGKRKVLSILDRVFPEYETLFSNVFLQSSRALLKEAATAQQIADFDLSELSQLLREASRGHFGTEKATSVQAVAQQSIGVGFLTDAVQIEMRCLLDQMDLLQEQIHLIDQSIADLMAQLPQFITTIPGVGAVTGAAILSEIGDIQRFESSDKLVAYAGIDATVYQTGQFEATETHMSKRGSPYLRHALWQAASMAVIYEPELKAFYQAKRDQGKHHGTAIGAVCRKLLARIFVILKEQRPYIIRDS
jgi:transposase